MGQYTLDLEKYASIIRQVAAESCVLLKNDDNALPLRNNDKVAVFGRSSFNYYKSGLGSGGLVNTRYVVSIIDALRENKDIVLDEELLKVYEEWIKENPYDEGQGWGKVPWSQKEMKLENSVVQAASHADIALVIIGRTAGEDQDSRNEPGSYLLTEDEESMIEKVTRTFKRTAVILNVGNIIDMKWVDKYNPSSVLYIWQGGQEGGNGAVDVLTGKVNPCGKLTDTIAKNIEDYPSTENFGGIESNYYKEDIYLGYRYFETLAKDKVMYPFGYGLSYTNFNIEGKISRVTSKEVIVEAIVTNIGNVSGKEVVQVYIEAPQGKLGKPARVLVGFTKTNVINPLENEKVEIKIPKYYIASYDDSGITGYKSCYVLEEGCYKVYIGSDVRSAKISGEYNEEFTLVERLEEACAPTASFERFKLAFNEDGSPKIIMEEAPTRTINPYKRMEERREEEIPYTGDKGYKLGDVFNKKVDIDDFVAQLSDDNLIYMFRGEGMCSPKVTPGTAAAFGGVTDKLRDFGIPLACCADGPSGIRMDCGTKACSLPNGTALGCTFNMELVEELYKMTGKEMRKNKIDSLLGPGMNIHRNPLNGRNFEYISEDPLLTGKISLAQVIGIQSQGVAPTIKHFCANNQEVARHFADSVVSERALREIYLKGYEIVVKEGNGRSVMTSYGPVNGIWTAGNYDLCTTILRKEWGFDGIVMSDWWANANIEGEKATRENKYPMVVAQNDLYMCVVDSEANPENDNVKEALVSGELKRSDLQRNAKNILNFIMKSPSMLHELDLISEEELRGINEKDEDDFPIENIVYYKADKETNNIVIDGNIFNNAKGNSEVFGITVNEYGEYNISIKMKCDLGSLAQLPLSVYYDNALKYTITIRGTEGEFVTETRPLGFVFGNNHYIKLYFGANGLEIDKVMITPK
ncbi:glycoside hydrolase family 3 C-terminal domain-containing protein [Clostridium sp. AL.422]|uniref:glycoside hydrolase family 3 protein n=1 Tax=Clostridium TaxID=1485 RepID=UPI00293DBDAD|nr:MULTISPECIES: glycoside hydrolase family 3 C-terminal domain-containing protein [unclassified Clostridium]MDV4151167.1 glycoside hydrolase family 3 C-terminal domain-containing protein [Clostridium sp. AL.422]